MLTAHPDVDTAIAVEHAGTVAAFVHGRGHLDVERLRGFAAARLPRHMVPGVVTVLDTVPLTVAGKIDRAALPAPALPVPTPGISHGRPAHGGPTHVRGARWRRPRT
ncbi:hypothetical protein GS415_04135 [Rhodococcus hoagii]|nr:hypothetical protein [Prescottella equi]